MSGRKVVYSVVEAFDCAVEIIFRQLRRHVELRVWGPDEGGVGAGACFGAGVVFVANVSAAVSSTSNGTHH